MAGARVEARVEAWVRLMAGALVPARAEGWVRLMVADWEGH